jgi:acetyltransferase-like isoleucine patch superfamily enzyme
VRKLVLRPIENWRSRLEIIEQLESLKRLGKGVVVNGPLMIGNPPLTELGDDVCINAGLVVRGNGSLVLGSHVHFGQHVEILTSNHNFDRPTALPYDKVRVARDVDVGDCVWFGDHVIVTPGVRIGEGAILGAGAVVTREVPPLAVVGGAPAKVLRYRDEEPYRRLRGEGKYLGWPRDHDVINGRELQLRRR